MSNTTFKTTLAASIFAVAGTHLAIAGPDLGTIEPVQGGSYTPSFRNT